MSVSVVRVVLWPHDRQGNEGMLIECLAYAGLAVIHRPGTECGGMVFDLLPPHGVTNDWARMNAERMRSFGLNAEECHQWLGVGGRPGDGLFREGGAE